MNFPYITKFSSCMFFAVVSDIMYCRSLINHMGVLVSFCGEKEITLNGIYGVKVRLIFINMRIYKNHSLLSIIDENIMACKKKDFCKRYVCIQHIYQIINASHRNVFIHCNFKRTKMRIVNFSPFVINLNNKVGTYLYFF